MADAGENSAGPRLPPAPSGPRGWPTPVPGDSQPHGRCTRAFPELGASCGGKNFSLGCLHRAGGGRRARALLWVRLTSFLSSHFHGNQPQPSIHYGMLAGRAGERGQGSAGSELSRSPGQQHCSQQGQAGACQGGGLGPRGAGTQGQGGDNVHVTEPPARARLGSAPARPPRMAFAPWTRGGGLAVRAPRPAASRQSPGCPVFCRHGAMPKDNLRLLVGDISGGFGRKPFPPLPQSCPAPPPPAPRGLAGWAATESGHR